MRRALARSFLAAVLPGVLIGAASADARVMVRGAILASGGWTDNARSQPSSAPGGQQRDEFFDLQPGMIVAHETPTFVEQLGVRLTSSSYLENPEARAYAGRLDWGGFFELSPSSSILLGASGQIGRFNTFTTLDGAAGTPITALPPSGITFTTLGAQEQAAHDFSPAWRGLQGLEVNSFLPLSSGAAQPKSVSVDHRFGGERSYVRDALGFEIRNAYALYTAVAGSRAQQAQLTESIVGRWRHELSREFGSQLDAGAAVVTRADDFGGALFLPVVTAMLRYTVDAGQAEASYSHAATANVFVGQTFVSDSGVLRLGLPLGRSRFALSGSLGVSRGRAANTSDGTYGPAISVLVADAALSWAATPEVGVSLRYQLTDQHGGAVMDQLAPSYLRSTVLLSIAAVYPAQQRAGLPYRGALQLREEREQSEREQRERDAAAARK